MRALSALLMAWCVLSILELSFYSNKSHAEFMVHPGYLADVEGERNQVSREVIISMPPERVEPTLSERIFNQKLTEDFQREYEHRFGRTEAEQIISVPSRFFETEIRPGSFVTSEEEAEQEKKFGEFMIKKLIEHHVDAFFRENPTVRPVYEIKERVSNVDVEVRQGYKVKVRYSLSSNNVDLYTENPYDIHNRVSLRMNPSSFGPGDVQEVRYLLGYDFTKNFTAYTEYDTFENKSSLIGVRRLGPRMSTSLTGSTSSVEDRVIVGFSWSD